MRSPRRHCPAFPSGSTRSAECSSSRLCERGASFFSDPEDEEVTLTRARFKRVAGLICQVRDVDGGQRIRAFRDQQVTRFEAAKGLACPQRREGTFQPAEIDSFLIHLIIKTPCAL